MEFPEQLFYSKEHTWFELNGETGTIGITGFAQCELGEIVYVDLPRVGQKFDQDEVFGSVEAVKTVSDLFMPVSGVILEINSSLLKKPTLVNDEPFANGWIIRIKVKEAAELESLLKADTYKEMIGQ